ncbi:hypothetical protein A2311_01065 [candidate division WOR-1 bacterium RIFOXYB2_FULL_48_7]|uniref:Transporter n=1 Tax=candidate division WOR-1 bacterium RIFOXYB2_FULL_48_7 TaxID=1802583 RepID=A0A1F4TQC8_UNCSA|nr:MAG: hypothetical protein A2311_01065 [candidate division WOR-1 bacterium RIFOXYB2_FULL_48_7]
MRRTVVQILFLISILAQASWAIGWPAVIQQAEQANNDLLGARKQLDAYQWSYYKSYSNFLPQISGSLSGGNSAGSSGNSTSFSYGLSASQTLFKGLGNYYNWRTAAVNLDYYRVNLQSTRAAVYSQLRLAYVDLFIAQKNLLARQKISQYRTDNVRMIKLLYDSGKEDKGNYLRTQAQLADAKHNVASARRQVELARLKLSQLIGITVEAVEGELMAKSAGLVDFAQLSAGAPASQLAKAQLELLQIAQQATWQEFLPTISLSASYQRSGSDWPPTTSSKSLSLAASIPIFPGGSNLADRAIAGFQLEKGWQDYAKSQKSIYYTVKSTHENLVDALEALNIQNEYFTSSAERAKITQAKYLNGLTTYDEWDRAQTEYVNDQIGVINANRTALIAEANWHNSYGGYVQ